MSAAFTHTPEELAVLGMASKRRDDLVVFAGRANGRLIDNVKYLYLRAATRDYGFEPWFFTMVPEEHTMLREAGLPVLTMDSHGIKLLTSAGALVMDDLPANSNAAYLLCLGAEKIQLWHGIPLKMIGFPEAESPVNMTPEKAAWLKRAYSACDIVASTSPWVTRELFSKVFRAREFMEHGYPRNDVLLRSPEKYDFCNADAECYHMLKKHRRSGGRVVLYMPTFRDTGLDFLGEDGVPVLKPALLSAFARKHNLIFLLKLHPYVDDARLSAVPGILRYPSHQDIYPLLPLADFLVTDYSSVYFDFLLLDRPILFFAYDLARYLDNDRAMFFEYESMCPGPVATTQEALLDNLAGLLEGGGDAHSRARTALRNKLFAHHDAEASDRICRHLQKILKQPASPDNAFP